MPLCFSTLAICLAVVHTIPQGRQMTSCYNNLDNGNLRGKYFMLINIYCDLPEGGPFLIMAVVYYGLVKGFKLK